MRQKLFDVSMAVQCFCKGLQRLYKTTNYRLLVAHSYVSDSCSLSSHGHFDNRNSNYPKHVVHFLQGDWLNVGLNKFCKKVALLIRGGNAFMKSLVILTAPHLDFDTLLNSYIWAKTQTGRIFLLECYMFADDVIPTWAFRDSAMSWAPVTSSMTVRRQRNVKPHCHKPQGEAGLQVCIRALEQRSLLGLSLDLHPPPYFHFRVTSQSREPMRVTSRPTEKCKKKFSCVD